MLHNQKAQTAAILSYIYIYYCYQKPSLLFLTPALSSVSANMSGKIKDHDACHEMFALMLKLVLYMSYPKCWFVKNNI